MELDHFVAHGYIVHRFNILNWLVTEAIPWEKSQAQGEQWEFQDAIFKGVTPLWASTSTS